MKITKREILFLLLRINLIPYFLRNFIQTKRTTILLYHDIDPKRAEMHFCILEKFYNIISLKEYIEARKSGQSDALPPRSLVITFDDGHKNNYLLKSVINKHKIPITIFLCSGIIGTSRQFWWNYRKVGDANKLKSCADEERVEWLRNAGFDESRESVFREALTGEEMRELKDTGLVDFQSHTITHPCLPKCSNRKATLEILDSKKQLENDYNMNIFSLSYPNGDYSDRDIKIAINAGYECALTVDPGFNNEETDLFKLKRLAIYELSDANELIVRSSGFWSFIKKFALGQDYGYKEDRIEE
jgi:poly-beta-1,6-N-acetyl-D-glucosamine N-deacetylase